MSKLSLYVTSLLCVSVYKVIPTEGHYTTCCHHTATVPQLLNAGGAGSATLPTTDRDVPPNPLAFNRFQNFC